MKTENKIKLNIKITKEFKLKISYIDSNKQETIIKLHKNNKDEYPISISFIDNKIMICHDSDYSIQFIQEWFNEPNNYKCYEIHFNNKWYSIISEVLFALIIDEFLKQIKKDYIIEKTYVTIPSDNYTLMKRIKISLETTDLDQIEIVNMNILIKEKCIMN